MKLIKIKPKFQRWILSRRKRVETKLSSLIGKKTSGNSELVNAMRHTVLNGGKRIRALLVYASGELVKGDLRVLDSLAASIELMHSYSLVHDDLPCMDDDDIRRGKPTVHVKYNEALAVLTGDALQSLAFKNLSETSLKTNNIIKTVSILSSACGFKGMCEGQALDMKFTKKKISLRELKKLHSLKTGALFFASVKIGLLAGKKLSFKQLNYVEKFADNIGLLFQIIDDLLDETSKTNELGKTAGKDKIDQKATFVRILGLEQSKKLAKKMFSELNETLSNINNNEMLIEICKMAYLRKF